MEFLQDPLFSAMLRTIDL